MKKIFLLVAMTFAITAGFAQDYNWSIGARGGGVASGLEVKYKMNASTGVAGILSIPYDNGFIVTGLYEKYVPVITEGFNLYYGAGAHIGSWGYDDSFRFGIDGIVGLEYKIPEVPIAFAVDYKPALDIVSRTKFHAADFGLSVKFVF